MLTLRLSPPLHPLFLLSPILVSAQFSSPNIEMMLSTERLIAEAPVEPKLNSEYLTDGEHCRKDILLCQIGTPKCPISALPLYVILPAMLRRPFCVRPETTFRKEVFPEPLPPRITVNCAGGIYARTLWRILCGCGSIAVLFLVFHARRMYSKDEVVRDTETS
jgi:hypothetical protein